MKKSRSVAWCLSILVAVCLVIPSVSQAKKFYRLPTASSGGSYYPMGALLASLWSDKLKDQSIVITSQSSGGSVEDCNMIASGEALMGFSAIDTAMSAINGTDKFDGRPVKDIRILSVLFPTYQSWGVTPKSKIQTMTDMKGKRISVGKAGATTERNARELLAAAGLTFDDLAQKEYLGWSQTAQAMKDGKLDGGLFQGAPPTAALVDLYSSKSGHIIPLTDQEVAKLEEPGVMYRVVLKPGTYPHQDNPIQTVARQNLFIVSADAPDDLVYAMTKIMYENLDYLKRSYHGFKAIDPNEPFAGTYKSGLKAHPGAIKFFRELGIDVPDAIIPE
jgi:hypothetical protein